MNAFLSHPRLPFLSLFAICFGLLGFGVFLQIHEGIEPCPMCIMQRYAFAFSGVVALVAGLQGPRPTGRRIYWGLIALAAIAGGGVAARQTWLQLNPPEVSECGPGLAYMLNSFPLGEALPMIFRGAGDCSVVDWTFLSLSIANWSLLVFICTTLGALWMALRHSAR